MTIKTVKKKNHLKSELMFANEDEKCRDQQNLQKLRHKRINEKETVTNDQKHKCVIK